MPLNVGVNVTEKTIGTNASVLNDDVAWHSLAYCIEKKSWILVFFHALVTMRFRIEKSIFVDRCKSLDSSRTYRRNVRFNLRIMPS